MLKALLSFPFLFLCFCKIVAQQETNADSLKQKLVSAKEDTNKVWLLIKLARLYPWSYPDSGILYSQQALQLAQKINSIDGQIVSYGILAEAFSGKGNYPTALEAALK